MPNKQTSLLSQAVIQIALCTLVVGVLAVGITASFTGKRAEERAMDRLNGLLAAVETTVSIACFTGDDSLATEVARGLVKSTGILGVKIETRNEHDNSYMLIAEVNREEVLPSTLDEKATRQLQRKVYAPFELASGLDHDVGAITIYQDLSAIQRQVDDEIHLAALQLTALLIAISLAVMYVMTKWVVRPVGVMSRKLHSLKVLEGERLAIDATRSFELAHLATDINELADDLVASLDKEKALHEQALENEARYHAIFDNAETGLFLLAPDGTISSHNKAFDNLTQYAPDNSSGLKDIGWTQPVAAEALLEKCFATRGQCHTDLMLGSHGPTRHIRIVLTWVNERTAQGVAFDISDAKQAEAEAQRKALLDPISGVLNQQGLDQAIIAFSKDDSEADSATFAVLSIDLVGFRKTNEALGMKVGDEILKTAARRIVRSIKTSDHVARIGSDKFVAVLREPKSEQGILGAAERIRLALSNPYEAHSTPITLGAAIGISLAPEDGRDVASLLRHAELAMRQAKLAGSEKCLLFTRSMAEHVEYRRTLEVDMVRALKQGEFAVHYQPIVSIADGRMLGAEALIRWHHPEKGMIPPDRFILVAEETGLIVEIGRWMLNEVTRQIAEWRKNGHNPYVSINVSGRQIPHGLTPQDVQDALTQYGTPAGNLVLEITEGVLLADVEQACEWLAAMRAMGIKIYLDDFGTGYSSLSYLKRFPLDTVKIDRSFIRELASNLSDQALVRAIIGMAHSLALSVVAEGVEESNQRVVLHDLGCENAQGYLYSKPVAADEYTRLLDTIVKF